MVFRYKTVFHRVLFFYASGQFQWNYTLGYAIFYNMRVSRKKECARETLPITFLRSLLPVFLSFIFNRLSMPKRKLFSRVIYSKRLYRNVIFLSRCFLHFSFPRHSKPRNAVMHCNIMYIFCNFLFLSFRHYTSIITVILSSFKELKI